MGEGTDIAEWCQQLVTGHGGLQSLLDHEHADITEPHQIIAFAIRCLANPACEGSAEVLAAIQERRREIRA